MNWPNDLQIVPIEINLRKQKWLLIAVYRPERTSKHIFLEVIGNILNQYANLNNIILIGDMNLKTSDSSLKELIEKFDLYSLINEPTCFKSKSKPSCIDLILTNKRHSF